MGVQLIYNVVLVSHKQQSESVTHIHIATLFRFFFHVGCYRVLSSSGAIEQILNGFLFYIQQCVYRRRQWHPTPVLLPGKSHGWRSLVGCSPWGREESDMTEGLHFRFSLSCIGEGNGNPLQCSCLENPRDGGAWWAAIYGVAQSHTTEVTQQQQQQYVYISLNLPIYPSPSLPPITIHLFSVSVILFLFCG